MKYVALLRGINVGGKAVIKMADLKAAFETMGHTDVVTIIQSGNVVFTSDIKDTKKIRDTLEQTLTETFSHDMRVVLRSLPQMESIVAGVPDAWNTSEGLRCYVAFVREPVTVEDVAWEVQPRDTVDSMLVGNGVVYLSTHLSGLTKSGFTKLVNTKIYKDITIRNYSVVKKILALMS